jgi:site-specific recombinase XerD
LDRPFRKVAIIQIDEVLLEMLRSGTYARITIQKIASHLRAFLRFAATRGWCRKELAEAVRAPRVFTLTSLPKGPSWEDVRLLLADANGHCPRDIRDRAILMLLAVYGLRAGEVEGLQLKDIDWKQESFTIVATKTRKTRAYPLSREVGNAILRYLREVRPKSVYREVFLSLQAPIQPMRQLWDLVARRWKKLGRIVPHYGAHGLRHSCASHLLTKGMSLEEIGDHLGHTHPDSTRIYAKVDLTRLRQVADFDVGGLL